MIESNLLTAATDGFDAAGRAVLQFLHKRLQFDLWMVTRTEGKIGSSFRWKITATA